ncbi:sensor histidine kinase [Nitrincola nitratireducens]|uniref:sensor histidine kinase n=1 Tax=Nitrincola nitratireducens TaxID=1229521 RepID=UPI0009DDC16A|nr:ATP-binding protein [Nitrincola nitratireducens]
MVDDRTWLVRDELGHVAIIYGVVVDVTELKRSELQIRELNDVLEQRVEERTNALEAANQELEAFTYSVSHDLKAPLRGIDGYSQLLMEAYRNQLDEEGETFLRNIRDGVGQMHQLIEDLLSYSRIERKTLQAQAFDVSLFVKELVEHSLKTDPHPQAKITIDLPSCQLELDPDGFALVIRNILTNALKFSINRQPPIVEIRGRVTDTRFVLEVKDNGVGFDMKYHDRIFQIFQRLHRREDFPGTGVGLALVKKAMQRMGGEVRAESELGKGALFILEFDL